MGQLGIGDSQDTGNQGSVIPVKLPNGTVINTTAGNSISGGKVLVAVTDSGEAYSFSNPTIPQIGDRQITRRRPRKPRSILSLDYPFKVLAKGTVIIVQGFDDDTDITSSGDLVGFVNTGEGYSAIIKNGNNYLFDVDGEKVTQTLNASQFINNFVPSFNWYGGTDLLATQTKYSTESVHTFTPANTNQNFYYSNFLNATVNNRRIWNYSGNLSTDLIATETWTSTDPNNAVTNCKSNFTFDRFDTYGSANFTAYNYEYIVDYYEKRDYSTCNYFLDENGLSSTKVDVTDERETLGNKTVIRVPATGDNYLITITTSEEVNESNHVNHVAFTQSYAQSNHQITKNYSRNRSHEFEQVDYTYQAVTVTYLYPFSWINTPSGGGDNVAGTPYTINGAVSLTSTFTSGTPFPNWTVDFGTYYHTQVGGNQYLKGDIWVYRITNPDGVMVSPDYDPIDDSIETVADNLTYEFNGSTPLSYPRATKPTLGTPIETNRVWGSRNPEDGAITQSYNKDVSDIVVDNYSNTTLVYHSDIVTTYYHSTNKYEKTTTEFYQYEVNYATGNLFITNVIRPSTTITDQKEDNPNISNLILKLNNSIYEIKDFEESNGFNFEDRFFFVSTTTVENLTSGTYNLNTQQIGVNSNNKGNFTKVLKRYQYNSVNNPDGTVTYHSIVPFTASGQSVEIYHIYNGKTKKYNGTITSLNGTLQNSNGTYRKEEWYNWTSITLNVNTSTTEDIEFYHWANVYNNAIIIVPQDNHTVSLLKYIEQENKRVNIYEVGNTIQLSIAKKLTSDNLDGEEEWYADIYEFNTTQKRFERIGNESGSLSEIDGTDYNFIQYHPT